MNFNYNYTGPFSIPPVIPSDINIRTSRISTIYPTETLGPYTTWKLPVRVATTEDIILTDLQTVDGISLAEGDRVLVKDQDTASENGIYISRDSANWIRTNDLQDGTSAANICMFVNEGTANASLLFLCTNEMSNDITGTDDLVFDSYAGSGGGGTPGGASSNVQYNNAGAFAGSSAFTFSPTLVPAGAPPDFPLDVLGTLTIGSPTNATPDENVARITAPSPVAANSSGKSMAITGGNGNGTGNGGNILLYGGLSTAAGGAGGTITISGGPGETGGSGILAGGNGTLHGGDANISSGSGTTSSGDIFITADSNGTTKGIVVITTYSINTTFINGGIRFTKDTDAGLTIANLGAPPTVSTTKRQGIITITDPSALGANSSINITVTNTSVLTDDIVYVAIQQFSGTGIPMVLVSSITTSTNFTIKLYNLGAADPLSAQMKISFQLV